MINKTLHPEWALACKRKGTELRLLNGKQQTPVYYRLLPGNIKDVSAFKMCLQESGVKDATVIIVINHLPN